MEQIADEDELRRIEVTSFFTAVAWIFESGGERGSMVAVAEKLPDKPATEVHFSVQQIAERWGLSETLIRELFENEPGVFKIERPGTQRKRKHTTLRIPESVVERVHRRMSRPIL